MKALPLGSGQGDASEGMSGSSEPSFNMSCAPAVQKNQMAGVALHTSDNYDRAGMWLSLSEDGKSFEVFDVVAGGPAAKAGIKAGDHILAVDGESVESLDPPSLRMEIANRVSRKQLRLKMNAEGNLRNVTVMLRDLL
jgi:predicted metalloprotease with PDZ domain